MACSVQSEQIEQLEQDLDVITKVQIQCVDAWYDIGNDALEDTEEVEELTEFNPYVPQMRF